VNRRTLGERARTWIDASLDEFAIAVESEGVLTPAKRHGELATVAALLLDHGDNLHARSWLDLAWKRFDDGELLVREIAVQPGSAAIYPAFRRHGHRSEALDRAIASVWPRITDPSVRLLLACSVAGTDIAAPLPLEQLLDDSVVGREPATWLVDERAAYMMSHVALFLAPTRSLPERHRRYIARSLPVWIARFGFAGYLDLVGEMIMVAHALGECVPDSEWQVLVDAQEPDGMMPFRAAWRGREVPPRVRFVASYHSTLTAYAAAAMCAHPSKATASVPASA
jgi:hypothetical protein